MRDADKLARFSKDGFWSEMVQKRGMTKEDKYKALLEQMTGAGETRLRGSLRSDLLTRRKGPMKAAVWHEKRDIRIEDMADPKPGTGQVKVRIKVCGICGSDLHEYKDGPFIIPSRPHPLTKRQGGPVILGHEFSAEITEVGERVSRFRPGDRVVVNPLIYCGECHYCKRGQHIMCTRLGTYGFAADGAFAEYGIFHEYSLFRLPDSVTDDMGAFVEPLAVAVHAVKRSRLKVGASVAIVGAGPIGLLVMQACRAAGAGLTDGLRADTAFDCVGNQSAFDTALKVTGRRGVTCVVGLALKPIQVPFIRLWGHEKELTFSSGYEDEFPAAISYLADGRVKVEELISERIQLEDLVEKGITRLLQEGDKYIKILVYP
jgi:(R,R)-butanediol dehydrogenase/meso-butanediol dehydrogenase/diacetyl reductase